ncbi:MAG: transcriptional repressor [Candidatus Accumulibacter sp.]|jgi:Fur family ferric uptake transcriptional regulator|nr:transcriptional repressor [Accumulibacter sp.]
MKRISDPKNPSSSRKAQPDAATVLSGERIEAEHIRCRGARVTPARIRVLRLLREAPAPLSHAEIEARLGGEAPDRVTLYRVLDWLVDSGFAHKNADAGRVFRFSAASLGEHAAHVHFRCERCGGVYCLEASPPVAPALPPGFSLTRVDFDLRGTCARCSPGR